MTFRSRQNAARMPAASPTFHSTGCTRNAPLVMCVTPRFLPPGSRFSTRTGIMRAERDLEGPAAEVEVAGAADARMEIDPVAADPHRVVEQLGAVRPERMRDVLLEHRELGAHPPRLPHVGRRREAVRRAADDVAAQAQARDSRRRRRGAAPPSAASRAG